jgi:hypothetical protein
MAAPAQCLRLSSATEADVLSRTLSIGTALLRLLTMSAAIDSY